MKKLKESYKFMADFLKEKKDNPQKTIQEIVETINMTGYHDALIDCRLMAQMFTKMVEFLKEHGDVDIRKYQMERIKTKR